MRGLIASRTCFVGRLTSIDDGASIAEVRYNINLFPRCVRFLLLSHYMLGVLSAHVIDLHSRTCPRSFLGGDGKVRLDMDLRYGY